MQDPHFGRFRDPIFPLACNVRILLVTDDDGSFTEEHRFGLTELINSLTGLWSPSYRFTVKTAHRTHATDLFPYPQDADVQDFRFDNPAHFDAGDFDEIWLFGVYNPGPTVSGPTAVTEPELRILAEFMDGGGGVFATGDHEDLGRDLCGRIPRVRSMRKWTFTDPPAYDQFDPASGDGPPVGGPFRHDTLIAGHDVEYNFDDQSDDIPAKIIPMIYGPRNKYFEIRYPHPLLCGPKGVIDILPDHMHEGECVVPENLDESVSFNGYTTAEYPTKDGSQVVPQVIAEGIVLEHKTTTIVQGSSFDPDSVTIPKTFGAIGAYDGHSADVGRVAVDSTFHHFFNINLIGSESNSLDPVKQQGFLASPQGAEQYQQIKSYYRNLAVWLAPPAKQNCMFQHGLWAARWDSQVRMLAPGIARERHAWTDVLVYGRAVRETMGRLFGPCTTADWFFAQENPLAKFKWWLDLHRPDPPPDFRDILVNPEELITAALGQVMSELVRATPTRDASFRDALDKHLPGIVAKGLARTWASAVPEIDGRLQATRALVKELQAGARARR